MWKYTLVVAAIVLVLAGAYFLTRPVMPSLTARQPVAVEMILHPRLVKKVDNRGDARKIYDRWSDEQFENGNFAAFIALGGQRVPLGKETAAEIARLFEKGRYEGQVKAATDVDFVFTFADGSSERYEVSLSGFVRSENGQGVCYALNAEKLVSLVMAEAKRNERLPAPSVSAG